MKNTIKTFLKINKIVSLVIMIIVAVSSLISIIVDLVTGYPLGIIGTLIGAAFPVAGFIIAPMAEKKVLEAPTKKDVTVGAVLAIVSGAIGGIFGIPAGIMAFILDEKEYPIDVPATVVEATKVDEEAK